jgi:hypothetical protein
MFQSFGGEQMKQASKFSESGGQRRPRNFVRRRQRFADENDGRIADQNLGYATAAHQGSSSRRCSCRT